MTHSSYPRLFTRIGAAALLVLVAWIVTRWG